MPNKEINDLRDKVKSYLPQYLQGMGIDISKQFKCISPDHTDSHPSMGILKQNSQLAHCLSCGVTIDIYDAAAIMENLPDSGPGWVKGTLFHLAKKFGVEVPTGSMSMEDVTEMDIFRAYSHAAQIIKHPDTLSPLVANKLLEFGWGKEVISKLGIGAVSSYKSYYDKMTNFYKHTPKFLSDYDLDVKNIFNENNLIYTIKDEYGSPVGFAARDLQYEQKIAEYDAGPKTGYKPPKYYNTSNKSLIYNKSKTLYLFNESKKAASALLLVEGQADATTLFAAGITSVAGICSTAFTLDHLEMIVRNGIKHIIFVLDSDEAGQKATDKFITLIENCKIYPDLRVESIILPDGKDPDSFIRSFGTLKKGAEELRKLPRIDAFTWQVNKALEFGEDPITLANRMFLKILDQPNNLLRQKMVDQLADVTKLDKSFMRLELVKLIERKTVRSDEEKSVIIKDIATSLEKISKQFLLLFPE